MVDEYVKQLFAQALEPIKNQLDYIIENMAKLGQGKSVMNLKEAAEYIGISASWLRKNYITENVPFLRLGDRTFFNKEDLDKWRIAKANKTKEKIKITTVK